MIDVNRGQRLPLKCSCPVLRTVTQLSYDPRVLPSSERDAACAKPEIYGMGQKGTVVWGLKVQHVEVSQVEEGNCSFTAERTEHGLPRPMLEIRKHVDTPQHPTEGCCFANLQTKSRQNWGSSMTRTLCVYCGFSTICCKVFWR